MWFEVEVNTEKFCQIVCACVGIARIIGIDSVWRKIYAQPYVGLDGMNGIVDAGLNEDSNSAVKGNGIVIVCAAV